MTLNTPIKRALFSALLVLLVSGPILGLKLRTVGIGLQVQNAGPQVWWAIGLATVLMFVWQLVRDRIPVPGFLQGGGKVAPQPGNLRHTLTLPARKFMRIHGDALSRCWNFHRIQHANGFRPCFGFAPVLYAALPCRARGKRPAMPVCAPRPGARAEPAIGRSHAALRMRVHRTQ